MGAARFFERGSLPNVEEKSEDARGKLSRERLFRTM
jgi:hypothetical protein